MTSSRQKNCSRCIHSPRSTLEQLVDELNPQRSLTYTPLFQVLFLFQPASLQSITLDDLCWSSLETEHQTAKFDLTLSIHESTDGLSGVLEYRRDLFDADIIQRMAGHLQTLLSAIVANPDQRLSDLPLLTPEEQTQLHGWNPTHVAYPTSLIHSLFEAQAHHSPD
ncbi:MAG: hypothetical protein HC827_19795, partial [Cyanobacteria bacterium RM1_2_2]|nr:hypothetical protein [Cyanobacteria bacterium RM1_2_2]